MTDTPVSLASLMTSSKTVTIDFPGYTGMAVDLCYLAREELIKLRKRCIKTKWDKKTHQPLEELDEEKIKSIKSRIKKNCSPKHVPSIIIKVPEIPRTKSGKIVEIAVKKVIHGETINNKEAIANPKALKYFENLPQLKS